MYDVFVALYGKANRLGGTSAFVVGKKGGCASFLRIEKVYYVGVGRVGGWGAGARGGGNKQECAMNEEWGMQDWFGEGGGFFCCYRRKLVCGLVVRKERKKSGKVGSS